MKLRCLTHTLIGVIALTLSLQAVMAQTAAAPPPAAGTPSVPSTPPAPAPTQTPTQSAPPANMVRPQFPNMPPPPPMNALPINVNTPGIEANVPGTINVPGVVATVNGKPITYDYLVKQFLAAGAPQFLDELINEALIRQEAAKEHVVVTPAETRAKLQEAKTVILPQYPGMSWAQFLALQGRSESYIRDNIYDGLLVVKLIEKHMPNNSLVGKVHLYHILKLTQNVPNGPVPASDDQAKSEIEQILADIQAHKETFQQAAAKESQDSTASKGGDLGWVGPSQNLDKTFAAAAFSLKEGEISGPVRSQYGWHLIYAEKFGVHASAQDYADYEKTLDAQARQQIQPYLKQLRAQAKVVNYILPTPPTTSALTPIIVPKSAFTPPTLKTTTMSSKKSAKTTGKPIAK